MKMYVFLIFCNILCNNELADASQLSLNSFKGTHPKTSGVQAIPELGSHFHPPEFTCATATSQMWRLQYPQNYLQTLLSLDQPTWHMAGVSQAYRMDVSITGMMISITK